MKILLSLNLLLALFIVTPVKASAELSVNQVLKTQYWSPGILHSFAAVAEKVMNKEVRKYDCTEGNLYLNITKKCESNIFSKDVPGNVKLTYQTKCFSDSLKELNFAVNSFGYDEDYTVVTLKLTTTSGVKQTQFCIYGIDAEIRSCPRSETRTPLVFSTEDSNS